MKNIILFLTVLACTLSFSQQQKSSFLIKKKTTEITGDISLWNNNDESENEFGTYDSQSFHLSFSPNYGYAIKDNLVIGVGAGYSHSFSKSKNYDDDSSERNYYNNEYSVFPYVKKYFPIGKKVAFSLRGELRYSHNHYKHEYSNSNLLNDSTNKSNEYFIGLRPGISLFVTKKILLKANLGSVGYSNIDGKNNIGEEEESEYTSKRFNFSLNSTQFTAGLTFLLN